LEKGGKALQRTWEGIRARQGGQAGGKREKKKPTKDGKKSGHQQKIKPSQKVRTSRCGGEKGIRGGKSLFFGRQKRTLIRRQKSITLAQQTPS